MPDIFSQCLGYALPDRIPSARSRIRNGKSATGDLFADCCVVDLETTGLDLDCRIVDIGAMRIRGGRPVAYFEHLADPLCHIPDEVSRVHHITDDMVRDAGPLPDAMEGFLDFAGDDLLLGYNCFRFDLPVLNRSLIRMGRPPLNNLCADLLVAAKELLRPRIGSCSLQNVARHYGEMEDEKHRALPDCEMTWRCFQYMRREFGRSLGEALAADLRLSPGAAPELTPASVFTDLEWLASLVVRDPRRITMSLVTELAGRTGYLVRCGDPELSGVQKALERLGQFLDGCLESARIPDPEQVAAALRAFLQPGDDLWFRGCLPDLTGLHICLTGEFAAGTREEMEALLIGAGATVDRFIKNTTDFLAVGSLGSSRWKRSCAGTKIMAAEDKIRSGKAPGLRLLAEEQLVPGLKQALGRSQD